MKLAKFLITSHWN